MTAAELITNLNNLPHVEARADTQYTYITNRDDIVIFVNGVVYVYNYVRFDLNLIHFETPTEYIPVNVGLRYSAPEDIYRYFAALTNNLEIYNRTI